MAKNARGGQLVRALSNKVKHPRDCPPDCWCKVPLERRVRLVDGCYIWPEAERGIVDIEATKRYPGHTVYTPRWIERGGWSCKGKLYMPSERS